VKTLLVDDQKGEICLDEWQLQYIAVSNRLGSFAVSNRLGILGYVTCL
jgi:hypothetical protein